MWQNNVYRNLYAEVVQKPLKLTAELKLVQNQKHSKQAAQIRTASFTVIALLIIRLLIPSL